MAKTTRQYRQHVGIGTLARQLIDGIPGTANARQYSEFVKRLHQFVRDSIRYVPDIRGTETLQTPVRTLEIRTGDCDDKSVLLAALLESIGFKTRFVVLGFNGGPLSHVMVEVKLGRGWLPLETIVDGQPAGWLPPNSTCWLGPVHV